KSVTEIDIDFSEKTDEGYELSIRASGNGLPVSHDFFSSGSLSNKMIIMLVEDQLEGELSVKKDLNLIEIKICFKVRDAKNLDYSLKSA
ncbi:MAG: hypothetical protein HQK54_10655, partial [Oligoflexales bacterium]|nr:hypothetical protein [Oligoflexales bacterium]